MSVVKRLTAWLSQRLPTVVLTSAAALFFGPLGSRALWNSDEGRYAEIAREMIERGDWIVPHLNGVLYFEKPPLVYWLTAISFKIFGYGEFAARFWCAAFGWLTVGLVMLLARRWKDSRVAVLSGAVLATSLLFFALTQFLVLDMALTFWFTLALFAMTGILTERLPERVGRYAYILAFALGGGFLTKGLIALIFPCGVLFVLLLYTRSWSTLSKIPWKGCALIFVVLVAPWLVIISLRHPDFLTFFLIREHFSRFLTDVHHRSAPAYFFIPVLAAGFLPWTFVLPRVIREGLVHRCAALQRDPVRALLFAWVLLVTGFYSFSQSKLVAYIIPVFPALALLVGDALDRALEEPGVPAWLRNSLLAWAVVLGAGVAVLKLPQALPIFKDPSAMALRQQAGLLTFIMSLGVMALVGFWGMRRTSAAVAGLIVSSLLFYVALVPLSSALDPYLSNKGLAQLLAARAAPSDRIATYGIAYENVTQALAFYTRRRIAVYGDPGELTMGRDKADDRDQWFGERPEATLTVCRLPIGSWVVTNEEYFKELAQSGGLRMWEPVSKEGKLLLFRKVR